MAIVRDYPSVSVIFFDLLLKYFEQEFSFVIAGALRQNFQALHEFLLMFSCMIVIFRIIHTHTPKGPIHIF